MTEPYVYTLKAILDQNEIFDSGDCQQIRREVIGERSSQPLPKYVDYEEYKKEIAKHEAKFEAAKDWHLICLKSEAEKIRDLEAKIEAANKILDSFPAYIFVDFRKRTVMKIPELKEWLLVLHNALLFPRKEEGRVEKR